MWVRLWSQNSPNNNEGYPAIISNIKFKDSQYMTEEELCDIYSTLGFPKEGEAITKVHVFSKNTIMCIATYSWYVNHYSHSNPIEKHTYIYSGTHFLYTAIEKYNERGVVIKEHLVRHCTYEPFKRKIAS